MSIQSWIKGKIKQREVRKLEPDVDFQFKENYYGDSNIIEGFNFIYCNNYTDKYCKDTYKDIFSYISCVISLPYEAKILKDLMILLNYTLNNHNRVEEYDYIYLKILDNNIQLFLKGDLFFYRTLCNNIHNNIFTKYIRNNLFIEDNPIETPNEYLDCMLNSINCPSKNIDILFIDSNRPHENYKPVIGLSISKNEYKKEKAIIYKRDHMSLINDRYILYTQLDKLTENELNYLINEVKYGDKLIDLLHLTNNDYLDIDEIIEE